MGGMRGLLDAGPGKVDVEEQEEDGKADDGRLFTLLRKSLPKLHSNCLHQIDYLRGRVD